MRTRRYAFTITSLASKAFATSARIGLGRFAGLVVLLIVFFGQPPKVLSHEMLETIEIIGYGLLATAAFGRVWCTTYIAGRKNQSLEVNGPYSVVRNPLYLFSYIGVVGFGMAVENPVLAIALAVGFSLYYPFVVRQEEAYLRAKFPDEFGDYERTTPRWIPNFSLYHEPESLSVNAKRLRMGIFDSMWFVWVIVLWEGLELLREVGFIHTLF